MSPTPPLFSLPEARTRFTKSTREALNNKNIKPLLSTFGQLPGSENEKKCTLDQAFRGVLEEEIINHSSCENVLAIISLAIAGVTEGICTASTPFVLLGDVLDCLPLDQCDTIFTFVEKNVATWKSNTFYSAGKNYLLRMCNDLLRRLSKSQNTVFCGRIQLFLARLFPLSEKSGLNLQSQFNLENVTVFNTNEQESTLGQKHTEDREEGMDVEEGEMGDDEAPTTCSIPIDYNLYRKFWSLQDYFRNPVQCYEKVSWKTFLKYSEEVLAVFKSYKLDDTQASRKKMEELKTGGEHVYFAKFLTSEKLMDLQLSDSNFRRHILLQYLILFQYLKGQVKFKSSNYVLTDEQSLWIEDTTNSVYQLLSENPPDGERFSKMVEHILNTEENWNSWKNEGCPSFVKERTSDTKPTRVVRKRTAPEDFLGKGPSKKILMGNEELTRLWNLCPDNMEACKSETRSTRSQQSASWDTAFLFPAVPTLGPRNPTRSDGGNPGYIRRGFLAVQHSVDKAIISYHSGNAGATLAGLNIFARRFPYPAYHHDNFMWVFIGLFPWIVVFVFSHNVLSIVGTIVSEKENRLKEYQLMIGLSNSMLWAAYFVTYFIMYGIIILLLYGVLFLKIAHERVLQYSDPSVVVLFLLCYVTSLIILAFMISTFFSNASLAVAITGFFYFVSFFPQVIIVAQYARMSFTQKITSCLLANIALAIGIDLLCKSEMKRVGVQWDNLFSPVIPGDTFTLGHVFIMLLVDACLYGLVTWYIEAVFPGEYGVPKRWYFFVQKSYWFGHPTSKIDENIELSDFEESYYFEAEPVGLVAGIQIQHLRKEFKLPNNTTFVAVKDLTLNFYEDQITVLLGPNGAGKTTTLSILTGFYLPTSGKIYISGYDISKDMVHVRKSLGLCPQYDLLFPNLTVSEHLVFYCAIKGVPSKSRSEEMNKMLASFGLLQKRDELSKSLSGGMKRKLSIMIALIGGSKVVILDEPTTGMDPVSRRSTWDVLQQYKKGRTMLLTTHYMDEADTLGDRIAIMVKGTLQCCGSSIFLKKRYGVGYHLVIVKNPNCDVERISELIFDYVPTAALENDVAAELSFLLPKEYTYRFEDMFAELEERQEELGIAAFGVSMTTLEEVFFAVSEKAEGNESLQNKQNKYRNQNMNAPRNVRSTRRSTLRRSITSMKLNSGWNHFLQQYHAMILKRALYNWRNWKVLLLQLVGLLGTIYFLMSGVAFARQQEPALKMDLEQYGQTIVPYSVNDNNLFVQNFIKTLEETVKAKKQKLKEIKGDLLEYLSKDQQCTYSCIVAYSVEVVGLRTTITFWFNNEAFHSPSLSLALLDDTIFKSLSGSSASITVSNKPQPRAASHTPRDRRTSGIQIALNLFFGMSILVSGFCLLTVNERITKAKHIQFLSGVYVFIFWFSSLMWDFIILFLACCLLLVVFLLAELDLLIKNFRYLDTLFIFTIFAWSVIPFLYLICFLFNSSTSAYMKLFVFNQCIGFFGVVMDFVLNNMQGVNTTIKSVILNTLLLVPFYNLGMSICKYYDFQEEKALCSSSTNVPTTAKCEELNRRDIYSVNDNTIGRYMIAMAATGFAYFLLILFLDTYAWRLKTFVFQYIFFGVYKKFNKETVSRELSGESEDEDVEEETYRVLSQPLKLLNATVVIRQLIKIYFKIPAVLAVRNISLAVQKKECFGLLGLNGAGKTTTFQILTAEDIATSGDVFVEGFSITKNNMKIRSKIGYCPQFDALLEYMTAREIMTMYARLWGVKESMIPTYVNNFLRLLELESHADKYIYTYSGGNKRRVSNAIAMMGKPAIIFLDEPSTGMDPVARRLLWNVVTQTRETGKAVIITSHSMEECDALCTRLAIMVQGKFVCLGSPQHLKNKFGNVYTVNIKFKPDTDEDTVNEFKSFIERVFPGSKLTQESQGFLNYYIPSKKNSWGKVFGVLEKAKEKFELEDYSISQITLEQVFLTFANPATTVGRQNTEP